jgi:hypothetical protein
MDDVGESVVIRRCSGYECCTAGEIGEMWEGPCVLVCPEKASVLDTLWCGSMAGGGGGCWFRSGRVGIVMGMNIEMIKLSDIRCPEKDWDWYR